MIYYILVVIGVFVCSLSQLLLKKSAMRHHQSPIYALLNWRVILAYSILFGTLVSNIYAMHNGVMLKDLPILEATGYVFVPILSALFLSEKISKAQICSIALIMIGIFIFYL